MKILRSFAVLFAYSLLYVQAAIDRLTGMPLPLGLGADLAVTAANVLASALATHELRFPFGATVTQGQSVFLDRTVNKWKKIDADVGTTGNEIDTVHGVACNGGSDGQPADVCIKDPDFTPGATLTNGSAVFTSVTAGGITHDVPGAGAYPTSLGLAKSTTKMNLNPTASGAII